MKNRLYIIALLSVMAISVSAQTFTSINQNIIQSHQILNTHYSGTIYEPFTNSTPSDYSAIGACYAQARIKPRKIGSFDDGPEGGEGDPGSPIGDAVWPLLAFALAFCGVIAVRRKRSALKS